MRAGEWWHSYAGTNTSQEDEVACAYHCRDNRRPDTTTFYTAFSFSEEAAVCRLAEVAVSVLNIFPKILNIFDWNPFLCVQMCTDQARAHVQHKVRPQDCDLQLHV